MENVFAEKEKARKHLRLLLGFLVLWDLILGTWAIFFAGNFQEFAGFTQREEPLFVRGVGLYWLFAAYIQYLGFKNPEKNLLAVQLSIVFRLSAALVDIVEAGILLRPMYFFNYLLFFFVFMNCLIAYFTASFLKKMNLKWIDI